ncbi:MAG: hypothetical protein J0G97_03760 [Rhizobium pusense]|nr:hypothetical protein [Agrobacterium pusense]
MTQEQSFTFYTYSMIGDFDELRWEYTCIPDAFFDSHAAAREAVFGLRSDIEKDPDQDWRGTRIEKIETLPISARTLLALLNDGMGAFIKKYEIIETID